MSRVEENEEMIRNFDESAFCILTITDRILVDISKSLAIIADSMSREDLSSVTPAEKVGQWISNAEDDLKISEYTCSNCKGLSDEDSDFCPKCGSYNGGDAE